MPVRNSRKRRDIHQRDGQECYYCHKEIELEEGVDHVIPVVQGGDDKIENLVTCCLSCNIYKGGRSPTEAWMELRGTNLVKVSNHKNENFTVLCLNAVNDPKISWKAKGLHAYLISRPPEWMLRETDLINRSPGGRDGLRVGLQELEDFGYITREKTRDHLGHFNSTKMHVYEVSTMAGLSGNGKAIAGKPTHIVERINSRDDDRYISKKKYISAASATSNDRPRRIDSLESAHTPKHKEKVPANIPASLQPLVDKWGEIAKVHGAYTQTLRMGVAALREVRSGKFFKDKNGYGNKAREYSDDSIIKAMEVYAVMRNDPDYLPSNKKFLKGLSLAEFFYSPYVRNGNGDRGGSMFFQCRANPAQLVIVVDPEMTKFVRDMACEALCKPVPEEPAAQMANKLRRYWAENEPWLKSHGVMSMKRLVVTWIEMLNERYAGTWDAGNVVGRGMNVIYEQHTETIYARG